MDALQTRKFIFGEHTVSVHCRQSPGQDTEQNCRDSVPEIENEVTDTVGWDVWDGATIAICEKMTSNPDLVKGKNILELGAGVGVVGILAGLLGARSVQITDYDEGALAIAAMNIELNNLNSICKVQRYDWGEDASPIFGVSECDLIVGSDLLYSSSMADKLRRAVGAFLARSPTCSMLLSHQIRHSVTWNEKREPIVENYDSVLMKFLSSCSTHSSQARAQPTEDGTGDAPNARIVYVQEHAEGSTLQGKGYCGNEGDACLFMLRAS